VAEKVNKTVLVTGAAGGVGRTICRICADQNFQVKALIRPEDDRNDLGVSRENLIIGYVEDPQTINTAMQGVDAVVNCAALLPNALHLGEEAFNQVNVAGPLNILRHASKYKIKNLVFFSTISVADHITKKIIPDAYLSSKINLEKELERASNTFDGRIGIIRPAFIYGPGNFVVWQDALGLIKKGKMVLIGDGDVPLPLIYAEDMARFVLLLLNRPIEDAGIDIYVLASHEPTTMKQVFHFIADYLGVKRPRHVPYWPLSIAASIVGIIPPPLRFGRLKLLTKNRVAQYSKGYDLSTFIDPPPLGFVAGTKYTEGLSNMLDEYKKINEKVI
jgi:nucleoside-diphosphate-sugar epimerase